MQIACTSMGIAYFQTECNMTWLDGIGEVVAAALFTTSNLNSAVHYPTKDKKWNSLSLICESKMDNCTPTGRAQSQLYI
ncbi:hypothetical protein RJ641_009035 [Dillenia turbinata]|uniref:Uncharacterized protein n=1 Tax=Dillenia turbinata TaxID=194707 RepID=A0AAN8V4E4_9MAGN